MTLSLIWHPRAGGIIVFPPSVLSGVILDRFSGILFPRWDARLTGRVWSARQIKRWETKTGRIWEGEHWPLQ